MKTTLKKRLGLKKKTIIKLGNGQLINAGNALIRTTVTTQGTSTETVTSCRSGLI
jgi:hypothetical protein